MYLIGSNDSLLVAQTLLIGLHWAYQLPSATKALDNKNRSFAATDMLLTYFDLANAN